MRYAFAASALTIFCACNTASFEGGSKDQFKTGSDRAGPKSSKDSFMDNSAFDSDQGKNKPEDKADADKSGSKDKDKDAGKGKDGSNTSTTSPELGKQSDASPTSKTDSALPPGYANGANANSGGNLGSDSAKNSVDAGAIAKSAFDVLGALGTGSDLMARQRGWEPADYTDWWQYPHKCADGPNDLFDRPLTKEECKAECEKRGFNNFADCANPNYVNEENTSQGSIDPLIIDLSRQGVKLTSPDDGVYFDLMGNGRKERISWLVAPATSVFLALTNEDGSIGQGIGPLFGSAGQDGFFELGTWDQSASGGDGSGIINKRDAVWPRLRTWSDANRDGVIDASELTKLEQAGIHAIDLTTRDGRELDAYGNTTGKRSVVCLGGCDGDPDSWDKAGVYDIWFRRESMGAKN